MSSKVPCPPPEGSGLSSDDENKNEQALWEHIAADPDKVPVPDWHLELLRERMARYGGAVVGRTWEEFEKELDSK